MERTTDVKKIVSNNTRCYENGKRRGDFARLLHVVNPVERREGRHFSHTEATARYRATVGKKVGRKAYYPFRCL